MSSFPIVVTKQGKSKERAGEWIVSSNCAINPMRLTHIFNKGQLISVFFGVLNSSKNQSTTIGLDVEFFHSFFERIEDTKKTSANQLTFSVRTSIPMPLRHYNHKSQINNVRKSKTSNSSFQK